MHKQLHVTHEVIAVARDKFTTEYLPGQNRNQTLRNTTWRSQRETNIYTKWNKVIIKSTSVWADIMGNTITYHVLTYCGHTTISLITIVRSTFTAFIKRKLVLQSPRVRPGATLFTTPLSTFTEQSVRRLHSRFAFRIHPAHIELGPPINLTDVFRRFLPSR